MPHKTERLTLEKYESESSSSTDTTTSKETEKYVTPREPKTEPTMLAAKDDVGVQPSQTNLGIFQTIQQNENPIQPTQKVKTDCTCCKFLMSALGL